MLTHFLAKFKQGYHDSQLVARNLEYALDFRLWNTHFSQLSTFTEKSCNEEKNCTGPNEQCIDGECECNLGYSRAKNGTCVGMLKIVYFPKVPKVENLPRSGSMILKVKKNLTIQSSFNIILKSDTYLYSEFIVCM